MSPSQQSTLTGEDLASIFSVNTDGRYEDTWNTEDGVFGYRLYELRGMSSKYRARCGIVLTQQRPAFVKISISVESWPPPTPDDRVPIPFEMEVFYDMLTKELLWKGKAVEPAGFLDLVYQRHCKTIRRRHVGIHLFRRWNRLISRVPTWALQGSKAMKWLGWKIEYDDSSLERERLRRDQEALLLYQGISVSRLDLLLSFALLILLHLVHRDPVISGLAIIPMILLFSWLIPKGLFWLRTWGYSSLISRSFVTYRFRGGRVLG